MSLLSIAVRLSAAQGSNIMPGPRPCRHCNAWLVLTRYQAYIELLWRLRLLPSTVDPGVESSRVSQDRSSTMMLRRDRLPSVLGHATGSIVKGGIWTWQVLQLAARPWPLLGGHPSSRWHHSYLSTHQAWPRAFVRAGQGHVVSVSHLAISPSPQSARPEHQICLCSSCPALSKGHGFLYP